MTKATTKRASHYLGFIAYAGLSIAVASAAVVSVSSVVA